MLDSSLYLTTPRNVVLALDAATGGKRWSFDPSLDTRKQYPEGLTSRGLAAWTDSAGPAEVCGRRIIATTVDARLIALDASTGSPCAGFGSGGVVHLVPADDRANPGRQLSITSPPAVVNGVIIVGSTSFEGLGPNPHAGFVRAFDARTGSPRWDFRLDANVWAVMSADAARDLVFLPTSSASPDHYGGERPGNNEYANSIVALRASTGRIAWSYQLVHHDLWDYDVAAQPMLVDLRRGDSIIPVVVAASKAGMVFVLHRLTGIPVFPVAERPVPSSDVDGERPSPTQPFPMETPQLEGSVLTADSAFGVSADDRGYCRDRIAELRYEGMFTPPSVGGTLLWPGYWGGTNWDGLAWDPEHQLLVTTVKRIGMMARLIPRGAPAPSRSTWPEAAQFYPQPGLPYAVYRAPIVARSGVPCTPPPWSVLTAVQLASSSTLWKRPFGSIPSLRSFAGSSSWGALAFGGPLITGGRLVFLGSSSDDRFRAFDLDSGEQLWEHPLPAGGQASPMTYVHGGRQYVVIAAGGRAGVGTPGDWVVAFALPK